MASYDIVMLAVALVFVLLGAWKGLTWAVLTAITLLGSYFAALKLRAPLGPSFGGGARGASLAMVAVFAVMCIVLLVVFRLGQPLLKHIELKHGDRVIGGLFGLANGIIACILVSLFAVMLSSQARELVDQSQYSGGYIRQVANTAPAVVPTEALFTPGATTPQTTTP